MVLSADKRIDTEVGIFNRGPIEAAVKIYSGALVNINGAGRLTPAGDVAGETFAGYSEKQQDNTLGVAGAITAQSRRLGRYPAIASGMSQADAGADAYIVDDETIGLGIAAQPVNVTGVVLTRIATSRGGAKALAYTSAGTLLAYGGGAGVNVGADGDYTLTAADGSQIMVTVVAANLPGADANDAAITLRHVRCGKIAEFVSATSVWLGLGE